MAACFEHLTKCDDGGDAAASDRSHLQLPLNSAVRLQDEISTPAIIQMLLEGAENVTHQVIIISFFKFWNFHFFKSIFLNT